MSTEYNLDYSIIISSYNPTEKLLKRCLSAVSKLDTTGIKSEIILVDNNSLPSLISLSYVNDFINDVKHSKCIIEAEQGLTHARMRGIEESRGKNIVFFDDDNEPKEDYLTNLKKLHIQYPTVAAWGPGTIWVDYIGGIDKSIHKSTEHILSNSFQAKSEKYITYGNVRNWQTYYPYGTGLCIKHNLLTEYSLRTKRGDYTAIGRKGDSLSSSEDLQMVLFCIKKSAAAGVSPTLMVNHLIPKKRTNIDYLKNLTFGTNISYHNSISEIFEERKEYLSKTCLSTYSFIRKSLTRYLKVLFSKDQTKTLKLIEFISLNSSHYIAINKHIPIPILWILRLLKINTKNLPL